MAAGIATGAQSQAPRQHCTTAIFSTDSVAKSEGWHVPSTIQVVAKGDGLEMQCRAGMDDCTNIGERGGTVTANTRLKPSALAYARMGFHVFPCVPNAKNPATAHGFHDATTDIAKIEAYWTQNPNFNIGVRTGTELNGKVLVVIDVDPRNGGVATLAELQAIYGPLPDTSRVITGRRDEGRHYYFWCLPSVTLKSTLGQGIDVKSRGGYVIAPPSIHPDTGFSYEWEGSQND